MKRIKQLNLNCRQASRLVSEEMDRELSFMERLGLRLHLMICTACRAWRRQILLIRLAMRKLDELDSATASTTDQVRLTPEARQRICTVLESRA